MQILGFSPLRNLWFADVGYPKNEANQPFNAQ